MAANSKLSAHNQQPSVASVIRVCVPVYLNKFLDYQWDSEKSPQIGDMVAVQIGTKSTDALVVEVDVKSKFNKLKTAKPLALQFTPQTVDFYRWVARYNLSAPGDPLRAGLISGKIPELPKPQQKLSLNLNANSKKLTATRQKVADFMQQQPQRLWAAGELAEAAEVSTAIVSAMVKDEQLSWVEIAAEPIAPQIELPKLNAEQQVAAGEIAAALVRGKFAPFLLDGVTGSGKTEVYFDAIARMLEADENDSQALIMVPEIALTPQWLSRFEQRFGFAPTIWHSNISDRRRRQGWWDVVNGNARVIIGARSSLFLPYKNLKLVVVDEEHDGSYKQDDVFRYHGRDMAVALANHWAAPIVLASATPSLETWHNAHNGRYKYLSLTARHGNAKLPNLSVIDMRKHPRKNDQWLSQPMLEAVESCLARGEQSLLFLNRRGVAPLLICKACGFRKDCPRCDASLTVHGTQGGGRLICHHCGFAEPRTNECPKCGEEELVPFGPGTRKVAEQVKAAFPTARVAVADSDAVHSETEMGELLSRVENNEIDILIGTQMVAKGHHFPDLTLVGVVDADMGLAHGDVRAAERTFQLLTQVAGRAGRAAKAGQVLLQSYDPEHSLFKAMIELDRDRFYNIELKAREPWGDPPFGRLTALLVSGANEREVKGAAQTLAQSFPKGEGLRLLGPAPAAISRIKDRFRYRLLVKSQVPVQGVVKCWLEATPISKSVRVDVDVDPQSFM